jgi:hypothetical protein
MWEIRDSMAHDPAISGVRDGYSASEFMSAGVRTICGTMSAHLQRVAFQHGQTGKCDAGSVVAADTTAVAVQAVDASAD